MPKVGDHVVWPFEGPLTKGEIVKLPGTISNIEGDDVTVIFPTISPDLKPTSVECPVKKRDLKTDKIKKRDLTRTDHEWELPAYRPKGMNEQ
jgi:hypothetical protein